MTYRLFTVKELAEILRVPVSWIYARTREGARERIPHVRVGKYIRFSEDVIQEYIQERWKGET